MLKRPLLALLAMLCLGFLTGCALSPQQLSPTPEIDINRLQLVTQNQPVQLVVVDGRTQQGIGSRGGIYASSSNLTVATDDITHKLKNQVDRGLRVLGFTPIEHGNVPRLTVTLSSINYQTLRVGINAEVSVRVDLIAETVTSGRRYQGRYTATLTKKFPSTPNTKANNQLVTEAMSDALNRMFADHGVTQQLLGR